MPLFSWPQIIFRIKCNDYENALAMSALQLHFEMYLCNIFVEMRKIMTFAGGDWALLDHGVVEMSGKEHIVVN
jgi:hypothetical protein